MSDSQPPEPLPLELPEPPVVDVESWNRGLCFEEYGLYPSEVALIVAAMVAKLHGLQPTAQLLMGMANISNNNFYQLQRKLWLEGERIKGQLKVWRPTPRAWRTFGFLLKDTKKAS